MTTDRLEQSCARAFARHETFHPRYGWFRKAVKAVEGDPAAFVAEDATVNLGVGKNMVRSIKYWGTAAKLITPADSRGVTAVPTLTGQALFSDAGADPYLEASGTLWLVHWLMLRPTCEIPVWWILFHRMRAVEFTEQSAVDFVTQEIAKSGWDAPHASSVTKDVSCLVRSYAAVERGRATIDDLLDCPLRHCGLIEETRPNTFRFNTGRKPSLPDEILLYAALDWMSLQDGAPLTTSVGRLVHEPGSPGRAFRLSEPAVLAALTNALEATGVGKLTTTAGATQLAVDASPAEAAHQALALYYGRVRLQLTLRLGVEPAVQPAGASA